MSKLIENLDKLEKIPDVAMKVALAYAGYRSTNHWTGGLTALIALKLATGNNLAGGAAGVTALTFIGLGNAFSAVREQEGLPTTKAEALFQPNTYS